MTKSICKTRQHDVDSPPSPRDSEVSAVKSGAYHDDVRIAPPVLHADIRLLLNVGQGVGVGGGFLVREEEAEDVEVEVVVGKHHAVVRVLPVRTVDVTVVKVILGRAEGGLDIIVVLRQDIRDLGGVRVVVCRHWCQMVR